LIYNKNEEVRLNEEKFLNEEAGKVENLIKKSMGELNVKFEEFQIGKIAVKN